MSEPTYRLVRAARDAPVAPELDEAQRRVVEHTGGPLLVLAGPGTGKTTTLVETAVARVRAGVPVDDILMLTFSRKAAGELRDRVTARLGGTVREPIARTLHSYAFGVLRMSALRQGGVTPRLLGGAEQDVVVRELLSGGDPLRWPEWLQPALRTAGFADELRDFIMRAIERGYDGETLRRVGAARERHDWVAAGAFLEEYEAVNALDLAKGYDQAALIRAAINALRGDAELLVSERARRRFLYVDEYQDTDPAQAELLQLVSGGADELILVGDPDQSIYAFRGADEHAIRNVDQLFGNGKPVPVVALSTCRRSGAELLAASRRVADHLPAHHRAHRELVPAAGVPSGEVEVGLFRSPSQEAAFIATVLRRAALGDDPIPWSRMAVLVRSTAAIGTLRRALVSAGVPLAVRREELPLAEQPVVTMLLDVLSVAVGRSLDEELAEALLLGPIGGADSLQLRRLRRELRSVDRDHTEALLASAVSDVVGAQLLPEHVRWPVLTVARVLHAAREAAESGGNAETILWAAWQASGLSHRWERQSLRPDAIGAAANRDLDAVLQLFEEAASFVDRLPGEAPQGFIEHLRAQQIPGDAFTRGAGAGEGVQILTAHASKGLEWDLVCVAGVQEGLWPDLRRRGTLLGAERLTDPDAPTVPDASSKRQLDEERRLFYVAVTRARRRLVVTAVSGSEDQPSRFLDELLPWEGEGDRSLTALPRAAHLSGLVADLRAVVCDPNEPAEVRTAAAASLAELAVAAVPGASPDEWWGLAGASTESPVRIPDEVVYVGPSRLESFLTCELRALMELVGVRDNDRIAAASLGTLLHEIAEQADERPIHELHELLDKRIAEIDFGAPWMAANERVRAHAMVDTLVSWLRSSRDEFTHVGSELDFQVEAGGAVIAGRVDRVERDAAGRLYVVDFKTGKSKPRADEVAQLPQLGAYQLAIEHGGFAEHGTQSGGAMLVHLAQSSVRSAEQRQPALADASDPQWAQDQVKQVVAVVRGTTVLARSNGRCELCDVRTSCPLQDEGGQVTS